MNNKKLELSLISHRLGFFDFECFIKSVSPDFNPAFLTYVDLRSYYKKIIEYSEIVACYDNSEIVGLTLFYCNNIETKEAYVAFLAVKNEYRGLHIATDLMQNVIKVSKERGMKKIRIRTNNLFALDCYKKLGYKVYDEIFEEENKLTRYYLIKQL